MEPSVECDVTAGICLFVVVLRLKVNRYLCVTSLKMVVMDVTSGFSD